MRIMIINPNSDEVMTHLIRQSAVQVADEGTEIICKSLVMAPPFIDTYQDQMEIAPEMVKLISENEKECDAFIVACHCDPNLDLMKELTDRVVIGIGEASMHVAAMLGDRFSVVSTDMYSTPNRLALVRKYGLESALASIRAPQLGDNLEYMTDQEKLIQLAEMAVREDLAEVIVLGCAGYSGLDKLIQERTGAPVLDGVCCAVLLAEDLVRYGVSISKIRRYSGKKYEVYQS